MAYTAMQELATQVFYLRAAHVCQDEDPMLARALRRVARDEVLHMAFYRDAVKAHLEVSGGERGGCGVRHQRCAIAGAAAEIEHQGRRLLALGCEAVLITNAAGSLRREMGPGALMAVTDHISFIPGNPLIGPNDDAYGPRFPALEDAYDPALRALLQRAAARLNVTLNEGVYAGCLGPSFETPAEIRAYAKLGADAVGMSTVPETIVARHCGLRVAAVSVITNLAAGMSDEKLSHEQTLSAAGRAADTLTRLVIAFLEEYARTA